MLKTVWWSGWPRDYNSLLLACFHSYLGVSGIPGHDVLKQSSGTGARNPGRLATMASRKTRLKIEGLQL